MGHSWSIPGLFTLPHDAADLPAAQAWNWSACCGEFQMPAKTPKIIAARVVAPTTERRETAEK
jgi:hypothetical protein